MAQNDKDNDPNKVVDINNTVKIRQAIQSLVEQKAEVRVWQKTNETDTKVSYYRFISTPVGENGFLLQQINEQSDDFNPASEIFIHSSIRGFVFKSKIIVQKNHTIRIQLPSLIKVHDARSSQRKNHGTSTPYSIEIKLNPQGQVIKAKILDSSSGGMALLIPRRHAQGLNVGMRIYLGKSNLASMTSKSGIIRNSNSFEDNILSDQFLIRIGLEIDED